MALKIMGSGSQLRTQLWENANLMYRRLQEMDFSLGPEPSPIIAVRLAEKEKAIAIWKGLLEQGIYVNLVLPPASPDGGSLLRCSVSAAHTKEQMTAICDAFESLREIL
jgi:8-amino-7-oxononanoate synthase